MVSQAQKLANKKWATENSDYLNAVARKKWANRYAERGDEIRERSKKAYERTKENKLERLKIIYDFKKTEFGQMCAIF